MRAKKKIVVVAAVAAAMALALGASFALAQEAPPAGQPEGQPGSGGPESGPPPGQRDKLLGGEVVKVENDVITIKTRRGEEKAVKVDDKTRYRSRDGEATLADVKAGEKIGVRLAQGQNGGELLAKLVLIGEPEGAGERPRPVVGEIVRIEGDTVTISTPEGEKQVQLPALTVGMRIGVLTGEDGSVRSVLYNPPERPEGQEPPQAPQGGSASQG